MIDYSDLDDQMLIDILATNTADYARMLKEGGDLHEMSILKDFIISLQKEILLRKGLHGTRQEKDNDRLNYSPGYTS